MSQPRIAIVGASVRAAAQSALRAGYSPVAADLFADADLRDVCPATRIANYPDGFCDWLAQQDSAKKIDGWSYTGALENYPELVDQLAGISPLWGNAGSVLCQVRSPLRLQETLNDAGLLFPETQVVLPSGHGTWLAKTYRSSSGIGVRRWKKTETNTEKFFYQRFIEGTPISALFVASDEGVKLAGITKQLIAIAWTHAKPFQYAGSIGPWSVSETMSNQVRKEIKRTGSVLAQEFNLVGPFGVDMILAEDQIWTLEVNPRYTAAVEVVERIATAPCLSAGKAILFAPQAAKVSTEFSNWALERSRIRPWPEIGDVPTAGTQIETGQPVLTVFAQADCVGEVESRLRFSVEEVELRLYA